MDYYIALFSMVKVLFHLPYALTFLNIQVDKAISFKQKLHYWCCLSNVGCSLTLVGCIILYFLNELNLLFNQEYSLLELTIFIGLFLTVIGLFKQYQYGLFLHIIFSSRIMIICPHDTPRNNFPFLLLFGYLFMKFKI